MGADKDWDKKRTGARQRIEQMKAGTRKKLAQERSWHKKEAGTRKRHTALRNGEVVCLLK
jgi:hypothetical protein